MDTQSLVKQRLAPLAGKRILDIGCGYGQFARVLAADGASVFGVDPSAAAVEAAMKAVPAGHFQVAGAESLPFADASFDAALFVNSLHHVPEALMEEGLHEAARVTGPGGLVIIVEPLTTGNFFVALSPIEDETEMRHAALKAVEAALREGRLQRLDELDYVRRESFSDFAAFARRVSMVDHDRQRIIELRRPEIERGFVAAAERDAAGSYHFDQPLKAFVLRSAA